MVSVCGQGCLWCLQHRDGPFSLTRMKPKILLVDTVYPDFLKSLPFDPSSTYEVELRKVLDRSFGTADFVSRNLNWLGWEAVDVIYNHSELQALWARDHDYHPDDNKWGILQAQIQHFEPDVVFLQDLNIDVVTDAVIAAQCSCPWPGDDRIKRCSVVYTSFPHYVPRIEALGVRAVYNPLAFDPIVLERANIKEVEPVDGWKRYERRFTDRIHDVVFIGGVGAPSHWRYGMEVLETVAREIPTFKWWGYGLSTLPADSALRRCYQGEAWGLQMYEILLQSKICLNRHGEVAEGYANNMRMFEATGCGAMLLTESSENIGRFFYWDEAATYDSPDDAVETIKHFLDSDKERSEVAIRGQARTLRDHTYAQRMKTVSETLKGMLCPA